MELERKPTRGKLRPNLDEQEKIWVLALWGGPVALLDMMLLNVDTLEDTQINE